MATSAGGILTATSTLRHRADDASQQTFGAPDARVAADLLGDLVVGLGVQVVP
jgi:hypothetical protein